MSTTEASAKSQTEQIPLARRISEIMDEKGEAFSIRAFGQRIGMSKDMLGRCLSGERYIKPSELERIAKGLNVRIERIKQEDTQKYWDELRNLLEKVSNKERALELATMLSKVALGISERSHALNALGSALFNLQQYDHAHVIWLTAYDTVQKVVQKYDENELLYTILKNLMISFSVRKEFSRMEEIVKQVEPYFQNHPERMGAICYSVAMSSYERKQLITARDKLYEALEHFLKTHDAKSIGVAQSNAAFIEYKMKNYRKAKELYEQALENLQPYDYWFLVAKKDYVKTLISLRENDKAENHIKSSIEKLEKLEYHELRWKFHLLLSRTKHDIEIADNLLSQSELSKNLRQLACKFLMNHFSEVGDAQSLLKYYKIAEGLMVTHGDILEEDSL